MSTKPRLLFLSHRLPFPPHNGAALRTYNILRLLARDYEVQGLCFDRRDPATRAMPLAERMAGIAPYGRFDVFPIPQETSRVRLALDHARSLARRRAYTWYLHDSAPVLRRLHELLATRSFDLVHVDSLDLVRLLPEVAELPVACTHHNVESQLLRRRAETERGMRRWYLRRQATLLEDAERHWAPRVALNVTVSGADAEELRRIAPRASVVVVPNAVDTTFFTPARDALPDGERSGLVFVGGTTWYPNRDALEWFVGEVLPRLRAMGVQDAITWVGRASAAEQVRYANVEGLRLTGYVDDIRPHVWRARCFIAPLRVGGGTRLKLLDAWAMGMGIVATPIAAEGLDVIDGENMLRATTADEFAAAVRRVLEDDALRTRLETGARRMAEAKYGWDVVARDMRRAYAALHASR